LKAAVFSRDFLPDAGGVQTWMAQIASYYGEDAVVVTRHCPGDEAFDQEQPYQVKRMPRLDWGQGNFLLRVLALFFRFLVGGIYMADAIRDQKTDVVHCAYALANGLPMVVIRILTGCPYVVYCHGTEILRVLEKGGLGKLALRLVLRLADRVVVNSSFMQAQIGGLIDTKHIILAPLGADSGTLDPQAKPATQIDEMSLDGKLLLVTHGRLEKRKSHETVARALLAVIEKFPNLLWAVVGDGPEKESVVRTIDELNVGEHVRFTGRLPDDALSALLARADLFVMPNRRIGPDVEGFGIVFLEAALFGVPAIAGRSGGAVDAVVDGETGLHCDGEDPVDVAEKLMMLLGDDGKRRAMGEAARQRALERTWTQCCTVIDRELAHLAL